jgi:hypothetical protein
MKKLKRELTDAEVKAAVKQLSPNEVLEIVRRIMRTKSPCTHP